MWRASQPLTTTPARRRSRIGGRSRRRAARPRSSRATVAPRAIRRSCSASCSSSWPTPSWSLRSSRPWSGSWRSPTTRTGRGGVGRPARYLPRAACPVTAALRAGDPDPREDGRGAAATPSPEVRRPALRRFGCRRGLSRWWWYPSAAPFTMGASPPPRKGSAEHMDISKLSHGAKLIIGGTVAFLIVSIFNWQEVDISGIASVGRSMWHGWGVLAGLLAIALLVWEVIRLANINVAMPVTPAMTSAALAILLAIFTVIKFLADNEFRTFWAWLGLILAIAIVVGAWLNMQAAGEGLADVRSQVSAAAASATAAAKSATDSGGAKADSAADAGSAKAEDT